MRKTRVPLLFGTMTLGEAGKNGTRNSDMAECQRILDTYFASGNKELDTARLYAEGTTEEVSQLA
jgi:aflatoxin B1 aldehyde reductase